jgi:FkbM family methyltransferase
MRYILSKAYGIVNVVLSLANLKLIKLDGDEKFIEKFIKKNKSVKFVQIGANDGVSFDDLYTVVTENNWEGIVIEPVKDFYSMLEVNYRLFPKVKPLNIAIHPTEKVFELYKVKPERLSNYHHTVRGIISNNKHHMYKHHIAEDDIEVETVKALPIMEVVESEKMLDATYLQIDTEGFDGEIIKMIDFKKWKPKLIKFESLNLNEIEKSETFSLLTENGYIVKEVYLDSIAYLKDAI